MKLIQYNCSNNQCKYEWYEVEKNSIDTPLVGVCGGNMIMCEYCTSNGYVAGDIGGGVVLSKDGQFVRFYPFQEIDQVKDN